MSAGPRWRLALARALVLVGVVLGVVGVIAGRWGLVIVGLIVVGLGAAAGPARQRR